MRVFEADPVSVVVPIDEWRELVERVHVQEPERGDTEGLLGNPAMKERLLAALNSQERIPWEEVKDALGL